MEKPNLLIRERDNDFLKNCIRTAEKYPRLNISSLVMLALENEPQRYYLDYDNARRIVGKMIRNQGDNPYQQRAKGAQAKELTAAVLKAAKELNLNLGEAVTYVLNSQRPSRFHISHQHALRIAHRIFKNVATAKFID